MGIYDSNCDLNKYKIFYAVAECKSFSKAAEILHITQPAISHAIKELENQLNTKLFIRNNKSIRLTDIGEKLMFYIQGAFNNIVKAENFIKEKADTLNGVIRVGIYSHISLFMLPDIIKDFNSKYPKVKFYIYSSSTSEMKEMLRHRELDLIIAQYPVFINDASYKEEILCEMESCFFGSSKCRSSFEEHGGIKKYPLILPFDGYADIDLLEEKFKRNNLVVNNNIRCYTNELLKQLVDKGIGVGWSLKKCVEKELLTGEFFEISVNFDLPKTIFSVVYDSSFISDSTKSFITCLKDEVDKVI